MSGCCTGHLLDAPQITMSLLYGDKTTKWERISHALAHITGYLMNQVVLCFKLLLQFNPDQRNETWKTGPGVRERCVWEEEGEETDPQFMMHSQSHPLTLKFRERIFSQVCFPFSRKTIF